MDETPREKWATNFGLGMTIIPAMIVSGFMPDWNVLPSVGWFGIATVGAGIAGAIATPLWLRGAIAGALIGAGVLLGIWRYVIIRAGITGHHTFLKIEIALGAILGAIPGILLFSNWARVKQPDGEGDETH